MRRWLLRGVLGLGLLTGCFPGRAAKSAGLVGCAPDEIEISNEQLHLGLIQSGETWMAECRGRTFICSQTDHVGREGDALGNLLAADHVSCTEAAESPQEAAAREARTSARATAAVPQPKPVAPVGAAGFDFGLSLDVAQQRCEAAGQAWDATIPELPTCSGPATPVGPRAAVGLRVCEARVCGIFLELRPTKAWSSEVVSLKAKLDAKYGAAEEGTRGIPVQCRSDAQFQRCLQTEELALRYVWRWTSGETLELFIGKGVDGEPAIRLAYGASPGADISAL
jgi:hypothetical protein